MRCPKLRLDRSSFGLLAIALVALGCRQDMHDQPKYEPLEASSLYPHESSSRAWVEGTVARGMLRDDRVFYTGLTDDDAFVQELPIPLDRKLVERGQNRYQAFCSPCHGSTGDGRGMVVRRGFKHPKPFHEERLRQIGVGYFFNVMTNGFGQMSSYAAQLEPADRWAIAAYIRALQLSWETSISNLSDEDRARIAAAGSESDSQPRQDHTE